MKKQFSALQYGLFLLGRRDRSIGSLQKKMKEKEYDPEEIKKAIDWLLQKKFLDDERFARNFIRQKMLAKPTGKQLLIFKLKSEYISEEIIEKVLDEIDEATEFEGALSLGQKWLKKKSNQDKNIWGKLGQHLAGRGYSYDIIKKVIGELDDQSDNQTVDN